MYAELLTELLSALDGKVESNELLYLQNQMSAILNNYNIEKRTTEVVPYSGYLPECYKMYFVNAKINGISTKTLKLYDNILKDFFSKVNRPIEDIDVNIIRAYLFWVKDVRKICDRTLENRRTIINSFFEWCCNEEYISKNPCRNIHKIKYANKERKPISGIELEKIRNACESERDKAMVEFLYSTGCRVSEMIEVKISEIDFQNGEIIVLGKGNKYRTVYLNDKSKFYLDEYIKVRDDSSPYLFVSSRKPHGKLTKEGVEKVIRQIGARAGIDELFPHRFRHTTATECLKHGMAITDVQSILGHTNLNTTMIYAKIDKSNVKSEHRRCIG